MNLSQRLSGILLAAFMGAGLTDKLNAQRPANPVPAKADIFSDPKMLRYAQDLHLAYIISPSARLNSNASEGLNVLATKLGEKSSMSAVGIVGLNAETDDLSLFPFIYWPVADTVTPLSQKAQDKVQVYLDNGGFILFDIDDRSSNASVSPALKKLLGDVRLNPLVPMQRDNIITKSFYLTPEMRGSSTLGTIWVEKAGAQTHKSAGTSVVIGARGWASAWAGKTVGPFSREREMAIRAGINMIAQALMGDYKEDAAHIQAVMERIKASHAP